MSRILIIEDEESIAELEKDYLELSDFEVQVENDGRKGLDKALAEEFDLIVLDLMLPGMDGFEICKRIREKSDVPILMVSARKDDIDKIRGLGLGADDYMTKPLPATGRRGAAEERHHRDPRPEDRQNSAPRMGGWRGEAFYHEGIRPAHLPRGEPEPRLLEGRAVPPHLEHGLRRRHRDGHGPHQEDPRESGVRHLQPAVHRDDLGRGLPL